VRRVPGRPAGGRLRPGPSGRRRGATHGGWSTRPTPLLPGTIAADREATLSCWTGERRDEHAASRRGHVTTRESVWIEPIPGGDVAVVLFESPDLGSAMLGLATSEDPFDRWFRDHLLAVQAIDLAAGMALPEPFLEYGGSGPASAVSSSQLGGVGGRGPRVGVATRAGWRCRRS
jgi:hypothetical protein